MSVYHISFATQNMKNVQEELKSSVEKFGICSFSYNPGHINVEFIEENKRILNNFQNRGAGFWLWKPWIILNEMKRRQEGDIIFYTDSGMHVIKNPQPLIDICQTNDKVFFEMQVHRVGHFTKRDCFILMDADSEKFHNALFIDASMMLIKVTKENFSLMNEYMEWCKNEKVINDDKSTLGQELVGYRGDHRHDQSILSILVDKHDIERHRSPSQFSLGDKGLYTNSNYDDIVYHHRRRDK